MANTAVDMDTEEWRDRSRNNSIKGMISEVMDLQTKISRPFDGISQIIPGKEIWKFPVRIVNLWTVKNYLNETHIEMVIMDSKCDRVQVVLPAEFLYCMGDKFVEFETYVFNNFKVSENDLLSRACQHPFKLIWIIGSFINKNIIPSIPNIHFFFTDFDEILSGNYHPDDVHDIIGVIHEIIFHQRDEIKLPIVKFILKDLNSNLLNCLLWGVHATTFLRGVNHMDAAEATVIIIRNAIVQEAYGNSPVSIANGFDGTKVFTDQALPEIIHFKQRLPADNQPIVTIQIGSDGIFFQNGEEDITLDDDILSLQQLNELQQQPLTALLFQDRDGLTRVVPGVAKGFTSLKVSCGDEKSIFVFSDSACAHFFGISAYELKYNMNEVDQRESRIYPLMLDDILGIKMVAKVKWMPNSKSSFVEFFSNDQDIIELIEAKEQSESEEDN